jgi:hypothetical protein
VATSETEIGNYALGLIGAARIDSFSDNSEEARLCNLYYTMVLEEFLSEHPWNFAQKRVDLSQTATTPVFGFDYEYQLPTDCLRVLKISTSYDYKIEEDKLLTDSNEVAILYLRTPSVEEFSPKFVAAMGCKMAMLMSYALTKSNTLADRLEKMYERNFALARNYDAQEGGLDRVEYADDEWLNARF